MKPFCKLANAETYVACKWDMSTDAEARTYWIEFFKRHVQTILGLGIAAATARGEDAASATLRADRCREEFIRFFDDYAARPDPSRPATMLTFDTWRDEILRRFGFHDAFADLKDRENERALPLLPVVCRELDLLRGDEQFRAMIEGVFAGNIFDMGAEATARKFLAQSPDFFATRQTLPPRPWLIDDYDALARRFLDGPLHRKAVFFIDNAGSDFLLGALPMIRWMAQRGTSVVLAANERPTLNDMTIHDVNTWWPRIVTAEPSFASLPIDRVTSGTGEPLIDLAQVSDELCAAATDADLIILEGMGRGVESNLDASFSCDALNIAMLKDTMVATRIGGKVFDVI